MIILQVCMYELYADAVHIDMKNSQQNYPQRSYKKIKKKN